MGEAAKRIATYADIEALPPHLVGEIIDGELHTMSRPSPPHAQAQTNLLMWCGSRFRFGGGNSGAWRILTEPELHLGADTLVPDVAGWRYENMRTLPETAFFTVAPDWVCEVLSPSTQRFDRARKMSVYAREKVSFAWLLDPLARILEAFELSGKLWTQIAVHEEDDVVRLKPFEEVELNLADLWAGF